MVSAPFLGNLSDLDDNGPFFGNQENQRHGDVFFHAETLKDFPGRSEYILRAFRSRPSSAKKRMPGVETVIGGCMLTLQKTAHNSKQHSRVSFLDASLHRLGPAMARATSETAAAFFCAQVS